MTGRPLARHLLRARDLADSHYAEPVTVTDMARAAGLSRSHFSREFKRAFGESPHQYLLTRRLERAAALLRVTDWSVADVCFAVGAGSVGSFTRASAGSSAGRPRPTAGRGRRRHVSSGFPAAWPWPTPGRRTACFEKTRGREVRRVFPEVLSHPRRNPDDQDRQCPVLGPRPGRGTSLLHQGARL